MFNLSNASINVSCPKCKRKHQVKLSQITSNSKISCSCGTILQLQDNNHAIQKSVNKTNNAVNKLFK